MSTRRPPFASYGGAEAPRDTPRLPRIAATPLTANRRRRRWPPLLTSTRRRETSRERVARKPTPRRIPATNPSHRFHPSLQRAFPRANPRERGRLGRAERWNHYGGLDALTTTVRRAPYLAAHIFILRVCIKTPARKAARSHPYFDGHPERSSLAIILHSHHVRTHILKAHPTPSRRTRVCRWG